MVAVKCAGARTAAVLLLSALLAAGCTPESNPGDPTPSDTASSPTVSPSPRPTPTPTTSKPTPKPDPEDVAAVEAKAAYVKYWKAFDEMAVAGGADKPTAAMRATSTGEALRLISQLAKRNKAESFTQAGVSIVRGAKTGVVNLAAKPMLVEVSACIDRARVKVERNRKPVTKAPKYLTEQADLSWTGGSWKVTTFTSQEAPSC